MLGISKGSFLGLQLHEAEVRFWPEDKWRDDLNEQLWGALLKIKLFFGPGGKRVNSLTSNATLFSRR